MLQQVRIDHLVFDASFDSGNACSVTKLPPRLTSSFSNGELKLYSTVSNNQFEIRILPDAWRKEEDFSVSATRTAPPPKHKTSFRTWFYFSVTGAKAGEVLYFEIPEYTNQSALFVLGDHRPVVRAFPSRASIGWERLRSSVNFWKSSLPVSSTNGGTTTCSSGADAVPVSPIDDGIYNDDYYEEGGSSTPSSVGASSLGIQGAKGGDANKRNNYNNIHNSSPTSSGGGSVTTSNNSTKANTVGQYILSFSHTVVNDGDTISFAFSYPHEYSSCVKYFTSLDALLGNPCNSSSSSGSSSSLSLPTTLSESRGTTSSSSNGEQRESTASSSASVAPGSISGSSSSTGNAIYYTREVLTHSLEGRPLHLITISDTTGVMWTEPRQEIMEGCFPDAATLGEAAGAKSSSSHFLRPHCFTKKSGKKSVFVSARVHPGETPGSFALDGLIELLLRRDDPRSQALRSLFVWYIVPTLNPDGVFKGHFRFDTNGVNLNRCYLEPNRQLEPGIWAAKQVLLSLAEATCPTPLYMYLDFHAHATKRGCFLFGNAMPNNHTAQVEALAYSRLVALHSGHLDISACEFSSEGSSSGGLSPQASGSTTLAVVASGAGATATSSLTTSSGSNTMASSSTAVVTPPAAATNEHDREGSGRAAIYKATGIPCCFTLEANYNTGKYVGVVPAATNDGGRATPPPAGQSKSFSSAPPRYTPAIWREIGRACAYGLLELVNGNPWSRLPRSEWRSLVGLKRQLLRVLMSGTEPTIKIPQSPTVATIIRPATAGSAVRRVGSAASTANTNNHTQTGIGGINYRSRPMFGASSSSSQKITADNGVDSEDDDDDDEEDNKSLNVETARSSSSTTTTIASSTTTTAASRITVRMTNLKLNITTSPSKSISRNSK